MMKTHIEINDTALRAQYDATMRRHTIVPGMVREETQHTVRYTNAHGSLRYVLWHQFDAAHLQEVVATEIADARAHAGALCWRVHGDDAPAELGAHLVAEGFHEDAVATQHFIAPQTLIKNLHATPSQRTDGITIRELTTPESLTAYIDVWNEAWPDMPNARYVNDYQIMMRKAERGMRYWAALDGDTAVATGYLIHPPGYAMALLCGGVTRKAYQRRGIYHALIRARTEAARAAGVHTLCVDASAQSAPVLQKIGFVPQVQVTFYEKRFSE